MADLVTESNGRKTKMSVQAGEKAPDFTTGAYVDGEFKDIKLSDLHGDNKWTLLFFYPGDFTFV